MEKELDFSQNRRLKQINSIIDALIEFDCNNIPCAMCPLCTNTSACYCSLIEDHVKTRRKEIYESQKTERR